MIPGNPSTPLSRNLVLICPSTRTLTRKLPNSIGTELVPETYIINKQGIIVRKVQGAINWMDPKVLSFLRKLTSA